MTDISVGERVGLKGYLDALELPSAHLEPGIPCNEKAIPSSNITSKLRGCVERGRICGVESNMGQTERIRMCKGGGRPIVSTFSDGNL